MMRDAGLKMTHVPYRGMPQAVNDVVGNHVADGLRPIRPGAPGV